MTPQQLAISTGARIDRAIEFLPFIEAAMDECEIDTPARQASFLSQVGHESGGLHWTVEIWGPTVAQSHYEGRTDLGNNQPGDGFKYRGRGLIQITGRSNYESTGAAMGLDLITSPELLGQPEAASRSAARWWQAHGCNELADAGNQTLVTRRINGGTNGLADRLTLFAAAQGVFA
jgi:putative chitinase